MQTMQKDLTLAIDPLWQHVLKKEFNKPYMHSLAEFLAKEREAGIVYPPKKDVFNSFAFSSYEKTRVVIIGQDPYHGPDQAHGLCFSVRKGVGIPPSLRNIFKELKTDLGIEPPNHGCLTHWAKQGVLLLNATLTVRAHTPKSHYGRGWEEFTDRVCKLLSEREKPLVFILWGRSAIEKCSSMITNKDRHLILTAAHPSPFSATRFLGCKHFSKTNDFLKKGGQEPIDWHIE